MHFFFKGMSNVREFKSLKIRHTKLFIHQAKKLLLSQRQLIIKLTYIYQRS